MVSDPPIVKLSPPHQEHNYVGGILKQGITSQAHQGEHTQRQQCNGHDYHLSRRRQVEPHQFRIANQGQKDASLYGIASFQHPAQQLSGISVVGWYGVDIAVFSVLSHR